MDKKTLLAWYKEIGVEEVTASDPENKIEYPVQTMKELQHQPGQFPQIPITTDFSAIKTLDALKEALESFDGCDLKKTAMNTVFSDGQRSAKIMVIGEAPGADEDRLGKPFVGVSGQLLDLMFAAIGLSRKKNIYITNTIPWRPPGNRNPTTQETKACLAFLHHHIKLMNPNILLLVGGISTKTLLETNDSLSRLRGRFHDFKMPGMADTIKAFPLYHPAYLLRSPGQKRNAWKDLLILKKWLETKGLL